MLLGVNGRTMWKEYVYTYFVRSFGLRLLNAWNQIDIFIIILQYTHHIYVRSINVSLATMLLFILHGTVVLQLFIIFGLK